MPREVRATYRRAFQVAPYETETVELSVMDEIPDGENPVEVVRGLYEHLAKVGDEVIVERMTSAPQKSTETLAPQRSAETLLIRSGYGPGKNTDPWAD